MNNLFLVNETFTNGYLANILNIISLFAIFCGVFVIISKNPVVSVLFLIGLFGNIASYLIVRLCAYCHNGNKILYSSRILYLAPVLGSEESSELNLA